MHKIAQKPNATDVGLLEKNRACSCGRVLDHKLLEHSADLQTNLDCNASHIMLKPRQDQGPKHDR